MPLVSGQVGTRRDVLHVVKTMLVKRRLGLTKVTKMKGHATGFWSGWDKAGNDEADSAADLVTKRVLVRAIDSRRHFAGLCSLGYPVA